MSKNVQAVSDNIFTISDFIKETITQIAAGLRAAQVDGNVNGVKVFPKNYGSNPQTIDISFDLAITQELTGAEGENQFKLGVSFAYLEFGSNHHAQISTGLENRIKFTLPIDFVICNSPASKAPEWNDRTAGQL